MLSLNKLLKLIPKHFIEKIDVLPTEEIDLNQRNYCHLIREGEILSFAENKFTQLLKKNDPVGLAETIVGKSNMLNYRRYGEIKLYRLDGKAIRKEINQSGALVKSIVKHEFCTSQYVTIDNAA